MHSEKLHMPMIPANGCNRKWGSQRVFADTNESAYRVGFIDHLHVKTRKTLKLSLDFILHSLRHKYLTGSGWREPTLSRL
ncbi:MAG: hypothetical protein ACE14M_11080 [Terriglobales bacterium]